MIKFFKNQYERMGLKTRYILSFTLIMALPLLALAGFVLNRETAGLAQSIRDMQIYRIEQVRDSFDMRFRELYEIAASIQEESRLRPETLLSARSHEMEARELIDLYAKRNSLTDAIYLYIFANDTVYASDGAMSLRTMTDYAYAMTEEEKDNLEEQIKSGSVSGLWTASLRRLYLGGTNWESNALLSVFPLRQAGGQQYGTVIYFVRKDHILPLLERTIEGVRGSAVVFDSEGRPIMQSGLGGEEVAALDMTSLGESGMRTVTFRGEKWTMVYARSSMNGLIYGVLLETGAVMSDLAQHRAMLLLTTLAVLVAGLMLAAVMAWIHYRPIHGLMREVGLQPASKGSSELETIRRSMLSYIETNRQLHQLTQQHASYVVGRVIDMLLGGLITKQEADDMLMDTGCEFEMPFFQVAAISCEEEGLTSADLWHGLMHVLIELEMVYGGELRLFAVDRGGERNVILLMNLASDSDGEGYCRLLYSQLSRVLKAPVYMGVGLLYPDMAQIQKSFMEAVAALERILLSRQGTVLFYEEDETQAGQGQPFASGDMDRLIQSLKFGNAELARDSLRRICDSLIAGGGSEIQVRCALLDITHTLLKYMVTVLDEEESKELMGLLNTQSPGKLYKAMQRLIPRLCQKTLAQQETNTDSLRQRLLDYVAAHFTEASLSLESIAGEFGLSTYYVSRFFSEQTGKTFKEHVSVLRLERARESLATTDLTLQEIVLSVGYFNVSSFIKKFKSLTDVTPGEYRRMVRESRGEDDVSVL